MKNTDPRLTLFIVILLALSACKKDAEMFPTLNTNAAIDTDITSTSAILKGNIQILGNMKIIEYGIEYSKSMLFTSPLRKGYTTTPVTGIFQVEVTGLEPNTQYYFKAYALINTAYVYSLNNMHFTTKP